MTNRRSRLPLVTTLICLAAAMAVCLVALGVPWVIAVFLSGCCLGVGLLIGAGSAWLQDRHDIDGHREQVDELQALMYDRIEAAANRYNTDNHQHEDRS